MEIGLIKWFDDEKGFGVLLTPENQEIFLHISNWKDQVSLTSTNQMPILFKTAIQRNRNTAINGTYFNPNNLEHWEKLLSLSEYSYSIKVDYRNINLFNLALSNLDDSTDLNLLKRVFNNILNDLEDDDLFNRNKNILTAHQNAINNEKVKVIFKECTSSRVNKLSSQKKIRIWRENIIAGYIPDRTTLIKSHKEIEVSDFKKITDTEIKNLIILRKLDDLSNDFKIDKFLEFENMYGLLEVEKFKEKVYKDLNEIAETYYIPYALDMVNSFTRHKEISYLELKGIINEQPEFLSNPIIEKIATILESKIIENCSFRVIAECLKENFIEDVGDAITHRVNTQNKEDLVYFLEHIKSADNVVHSILTKFFDDGEYGLLLEQARTIDADIFSKYDRLVFDTVAQEQYFDLWQRKIGNIRPWKYISTYLNHESKRYLELKKWFEKGILTKEEVVDLLIINIKSNTVIDDRYKFCQVFNAIKAMVELEPNYAEIIAPFETDFMALILWHLKERDSFNFETLKGKFIYFKPEDQVSIFKRLFYLKHHGKIDFDIEKLDKITRADFNLYIANKDFHDDFVLDVSTHIIIEAIKSFVKKSNFLFESDLILKDLKKNGKRKFKVDKYFDYCEGRMTARWNWDREGTISQVSFGQNKFYYAIAFAPGQEATTRSNYSNYTYYQKNPNFEHLKEEVRKLSGRKWNPSEQHWGVPSKYKEEVYEFAKENRFFINLKDGKHYDNNIHLAEFTRYKDDKRPNAVNKNIPNGITFCEGRKANKEHRRYKKEFWWCANQECFQNCAIDHLTQDITTNEKNNAWEEYTLLDFLKILDINVDEHNGFALIENGHYHKLLGHVNAFNRLLERIYCEECEHLLYPTKSSHFALYRDTEFHCIEDSCSKKHMKIYLNNCSYGECKTIIDSRVSKRCEHGLYICPNCGTCCSQEFFERRLDNLRTVGGNIHPQLIHNVENNNGHMNKKEYYCYNCSDMMTEMSEDKYKCRKCDITYNLDKFEWINRRWTEVHNRRSDYPVYSRSDGNDGILPI